MPWKKRKRVRSILNKPHLIPAEMIEEILLNLPLKSLVRFSTVSKSWYSMIFDDPVFARKHKNRAALLRRQRLVVYMNADGFEASSFCSLAPISSDLHFHVTMKPHLSRDGNGRLSVPFFSAFSDANIDARDIAGQFRGKPYLRACCDEFWCVQVYKCLYLWNPSMRNTIQLRRPFSFKKPLSYHEVTNFLYGLAYDSVYDDYKILKIRQSSPHKTELYSLKHDCWRKIKSFPSDVGQPFREQSCVFVAGRFHWIGFTAAKAPIIVSFDLSTEKYGEVAQPPYDAKLNFKSDFYYEYLEVVVLKGMLCASLNYSNEGRFVLWAMEEYGVEKSWTKRIDIRLPFYTVSLGPEELTPLYLFDNNDLLVKIYEHFTDYMHIFMCRNGEAKPTEIVKCCNRSNIHYQADAFLYVESLITDKNFSKHR